MSWNINVGGVNYSVAFDGIDDAGNGRFKINDVPATFPSTFVKDVGIFYPVTGPGSKAYVKTDFAGSAIDMAYMGKYVNSGAELETTAAQALGEATAPLAAPVSPGAPYVSSAPVTPALNVQPVSPEQAKKNSLSQKKSNSWYFLFTVLTIVSIFTTLIGDFYFYVSAITPLFAVSLLPSPMGLIVALVLAGIMLGVHFWGKKKTAGLWVAVALVALDTLILVDAAIFDFSYFIIDIIVHIIVLVTTISSAVASGKLKKLEQQEATAAPMSCNNTYAAPAPAPGIPQYNPGAQAPQTPQYGAAQQPAQIPQYGPATPAAQPSDMSGSLPPSMQDSPSEGDPTAQ